MNTIRSFTGPYRFLSNFSPSPIKYQGIIYPTVEHAYQALKTFDMDVREKVAGLKTPGEAKRFGRSVALRPDWDNVKVMIMESLLVQKFMERELREKLLATGDSELIEGNYWGDRFWGVCRGEGQNELGKALMRVRKYL